MNRTLSHPHLASYAAGAALGAGLLVSILDHGLPALAQAVQTAATASPQVTSDHAAAVIAATVLRDRLMSGGSTYAAAKIGVPPAQMEGALEADRALKRLQAGSPSSS